MIPPRLFSRLKLLAWWVWVVILAGLWGCTRPPAAPEQVQQAGVGLATAVPATPSPLPETATSVPTTTTVTRPDPSATPDLPRFVNPVAVSMAAATVTLEAEFVHLNADNTGLWQYEPNRFLHPVALTVHHETAYLIDGGRLLALDLAQPQSPRVLLAPGDVVAEAPVLELLDVLVINNNLVVLDRVGDVYRYDLATAVWTLERYERPIGETSSHYVVAMGQDAAGGNLRYQLEASYHFARQYEPDGSERLWALPTDSLPVDVTARAGDVYILTQSRQSVTATVSLYRETALIDDFTPPIEIRLPRQLEATETAVYVLDQAGRRLLALAPQSGVLLRLYQLPQAEPASAFWVDPQTADIVLAGEDRLYFYRQPQRLATIPGGLVLSGLQPHQTAVRQALGLLAMPIQGSDLASRALQMPGAPRHYRLGLHQGLDFYWAPGTPVRAAADGVVVRADHDYETPPEREFNWRRTETLELGYSTPEDLDFYRGRQVWIEHADGSVARYAHLSQIEEELTVGTAVSRGQLIGQVGNSGSPVSVKSSEEDAHLHFELWLGDHYLGQFLRPVEIQELIGRLFSPSP